MSDKARHSLVFGLAVGLLGGLLVTRPAWHAALGVAAFLCTLALDPAVAKRAGAPRRWLMTALVLAAIGAWIGPGAQRMGSLSISTTGALAATTMVSRAVGLVLLGAAALALFPPERAFARLRGTRLRRFTEVVVIALDLAPSLVTALEGARADIGAREPGVGRAPKRAFELLVFAIMHASKLADSVASRLASDAQPGSST